MTRTDKKPVYELILNKYTGTFTFCPVSLLYGVAFPTEHTVTSTHVLHNHYIL